MQVFDRDSQLNNGVPDPSHGIEVWSVDFPGGLAQLIQGFVDQLESIVAVCLQQLQQMEGLLWQVLHPHQGSGGQHTTGNYHRCKVTFSWSWSSLSAAASFIFVTPTRLPSKWCVI